MVDIRYTRPPDQVDIYVQELVLDRPDLKVTLLRRFEAERSLSIGEHIILETGAPVVWFVFPDAWHDIGRFHLRSGTFSGYYANLIRPAKMVGEQWEIEDLFLDLWLDRENHLTVLDEEEFDRAVANRWIDAGTARQARRELDRLICEFQAGRWPPGVVREYDLETVLKLRSRTH